MSQSPNPPAYPRPYSEDSYGDPPIARDAQLGMTLRDYFAGQVLAGIAERGCAAPMKDGDSEKQSTNIARLSYTLADAMLRERDK